MNSLRKITAAPRKALLSLGTRCAQAVGALFRKTGQAVKTGAVTAARAVGASLRKAGQAVKTGATAAARAVGAWFRKTGPAVKASVTAAARAAAAWLRKAGPAIKTGVATAARTIGAWFRIVGPAIRTGVSAVARVTGVWLREIGLAVKTGVAVAARAAAAWLRKAGPAIRTGVTAAARAVGAWLRKIGLAVKTGAVAAARVTGAWLRKIGLAVKIGVAAVRTTIAGFRKAGSVIKTGATAAARVTGAWLRKIGFVIRTGAAAAARAIGAGLRKAGSAIKTGAAVAARAIGALFRKTGQAVKTGAAATARAAAAWLRKAGQAVKTGAAATARAAAAWLRKAGPAIKTGAAAAARAIGAGLRKAGPAIKTGAAAARAIGAWFRIVGPAIRTGVSAAAQAVGAWLRIVGPAIRTGVTAAARAVGAWLRKAGPAAKTGAAVAARVISAWFRKAGPAVKTGAAVAARAIHTGFRKTGPAIKTGAITAARAIGACLRADRYSGFAGAGILLIILFVNILLLKQPDMGFSLQKFSNRTLIFTQWWEHSLDAGILEELIDEFQRQNPDIRVTLDTRPYTEIRELLTRTDDSAGGRDADILGLDPRWFAEPAVTGRLEPLSRYYKKDENSGGFYAAAEIPYGEWGRPLVSFMMPLFYNIDLLEAAGFDRPPKNQADFAAFAKAVTGPDRFGFALALSPEDPRGLYRDILPWIRPSLSFADSDGEARLNAAEISAALDFLNGLQKDGSLAPGSFTKTGKDRVAEFMEGRVAMIIASMADARPIRNAEFNCGITTIPLRDAHTGKPLYALDQWYVGIARDTPHKEDALLFIDFLAGKAPVLSEHSGSIPWNGNTGGMYTGEYPLLSKAYEIYYTGETRTEYAERWKPSLFEKIMTEELRQMLESGQSPEDTAKDIQRRLEAGY